MKILISVCSVCCCIPDAIHLFNPLSTYILPISKDYQTVVNASFTEPVPRYLVFKQNTKMASAYKVHHLTKHSPIVLFSVSQLTTYKCNLIDIK